MINGYKYQKRYKEKKKKQGLKWCRGNRTAQSQRYRAKNRIKIMAQRKLNNAIIYNRIKKPDICSICNTKGLIMAHHHDYNKPLDVIWVCWNCHNTLHITVSGLS